MDEPENQTPIDAAAVEKPETKAEKKKKAEKEKKVEKVVSSAKEIKPSLGERMKDIFFSGDFTGAARYVATEVLLPAMRNLIVETVSTAVERAVYGETRRRPRSAHDPRPQYRYDRAGRNSERRGYVPDQPLPPSSRRHVSVNDVVLGTREEAELVLERMNDIIDQYEVVSVADFKELCGLPNHYVDNTWGWHTLVSAVIRQDRTGYILILPPEEAL